MVKSLIDCCLHHLADNIAHYEGLDVVLTRHQKEMLLTRMSVHEQFTTDRMKYVKMYLFSSQLKRLKLSSSTQVDDDFLICLSKKKCLFEEIDIDSCKAITDNGLVELLRNQINLCSIHLNNLPLLTGSSFLHIHSQKLQKILLKKLVTLKDQYVLGLLSNCPTAKVLDLHYCRELSDACIMGIAAILKDNLCVLRIAGVALVTCQALESLAKLCNNLSELKLYGLNKLSQSGINKVLCELKLQHVDISYTCGYNGEAAHFTPGRFTNTISTFISCGVQVKDGFINDLVDRCQNLSCLELCGMDAVTDASIRVIAKQCGEKLKEIDLSYCKNFTDHGLDLLICFCRKLEKISVQSFKGHGRSLAVLSQRDNVQQAEYIKKLYFPGCREFHFSTMFEIVPSLCNLSDLNVAGMNGITDDFLELLSKHCRLLQHVNFKGCSQITDAGVCRLLQCAGLVDIVLCGATVLTDQIIFMMASNISHTLESLYVSGCNLLSPHALHYLQDVCVKKLHIQHRTPGISLHQIMAKNLDTGHFCRADLMY